ncbi:MAG TPA: DMT family transporter [Brevundimonas sp.]|jgi:drug/metabolite transporter (DMT)-like permease|uniref:DMT family transporter n=1 Tax=Brevundimonas sp. TaxID=1871086 RepID=UPI002BCB8A9F|nr:DMT family transporter [Brevundimonas sp.]HRH21365.1 DMT family transporter [Brevundimonas sp.]
MDRRALIGVACGVGAGALWGLVFLAPKLVPEASPVAMSAGRYLAYGVLALMLVLPRWAAATRALDRKAWVGLAGLSLTGNIVYFCLLVVGVHLAGVAASALIVGMVPVAVVLWGLREPGAVRMTKLALPVLLAVVAVGLIGWEALQRPSDGHAVDAGEVALGLACAFGALVAWSAYAIGNARWLARNEQVSAQDGSLLTGVVTGALALGLIPLALLMPQAAWGDGVWPRFLAVSAAVALGASILGNALWNRASQLMPLTMLGQMIVFETLFALVYGFIYEGRWPTGIEVVAVVLMIVSVIWCVRAHRPAAEAVVEGDH